MAHYTLSSKCGFESYFAHLADFSELREVIYASNRARLRERVRVRTYHVDHHETSGHVLHSEDSRLVVELAGSASIHITRRGAHPNHPVGLWL